MNEPSFTRFPTSTSYPHHSMWPYWIIIPVWAATMMFCGYVIMQPPVHVTVETQDIP
jgi:hypothetical protein